MVASDRTVVAPALAVVPGLHTDVLAYIALGGNVGDAQATVRWAVAQIAALPQTRLQAQSSLYLSAPMDATGPDYVNAVISVATGLNAPELLSSLQQIETQAGRERPFKNAPRTLDLDLLLYGSARLQSSHLIVPHPRMYERAFVLLPLAEIAPGQVSATQLEKVQGQSIKRLPSD